jgi:predicted dehydrogenase
MASSSGGGCKTELVTVEIRLEGEEPVTISVSRDLSEPGPDVVDDRPYSFEWTGRHDGGELVVDHGSGHLPNLVQALGEAKARAEDVLRPLAERERSALPMSAAKRVKPNE